MLSASSCVDVTITTLISSTVKVSSSSGGFSGTLVDNAQFGSSVTPVGDLDNNDVTELAVGSPGSNDGGTARGAVWLLFLNTDATVASQRKISDTEGNFRGILSDDDRFGSSVDALGDLDGDGVNDIVVGAPFDDDGGVDKGAIWILFLEDDGTVRDESKISETSGGFPGLLQSEDYFGTAVANIGDLDGDGITDLAVTATGDDEGGRNTGAVWILFMDATGTVKAASRITGQSPVLDGILARETGFGQSVAGIGDYDGDSVPDIAVGSPLDDTGGTDRGAVWMLFLNRSGTVKSTIKFAHDRAGIGNGLADGERFGSSVANIGDLDGNGVEDLAVGSAHGHDGNAATGYVWLLYMEAVDRVISKTRLDSTTNGFTGSFDDADRFGSAVANIGDIDDNGVNDIAIGASLDDDGGTDRGAIWSLLMLEADTDTDRKYLDFGRSD